MKPKYNFLTIIGIMAVIIMSFGCATVPKEINSEESLRTAADRYWKLRLNENFDDTYRMENDEGLPPFEAYKDGARAMKKIQIVSISAKDVKVDGNMGEVKLDWIIRLPSISKPVHNPVEDSWIFRDGKWLHLFSGRQFSPAPILK